MVKRSSIGVVGLGSLLLVLLVGCQFQLTRTSLGQSPAPLAAPASKAAVEAAKQLEIWGQVPKQCLCHGEPLARVANDLQNAGLPVAFTLQPPVEGWQRFSVTFDPARVSQQQVVQILVAAGAQVVPAPN